MAEKECEKFPTFDEWLKIKRDYIVRHGLDPVVNRKYLRVVYRSYIDNYVLVCSQLEQLESKKKKLLDEIKKFKRKQAL